ncbi:MAG: RsmB/NOP family class I SAM-dependent RNA methyltransferase [Chloroflexi bacterium]|nr:RsmB/NOP family class I SAM-dependent RNA methyltransferase [Chloroflexota bacterium]
MTPAAWQTLPPKFLERIPHIIPADQLDGVLHSFTVKPPTTFRVNTLKATREQVREKITALGFQFEEVEWLPGAFILRSKSKAELIETPVYLNGEIYVQSLSSMLPPLVMNPQPGEKICDLTAAPGSKTTQMAATMNNTGEIVANDRSRIRLSKLAANLKMQGVTNVRITRLHAELLWKEFPEYFDKTLVDAPCSLEGRFQTGDPKSFRDWSPRKIQVLHKMQCWMLRSAVSATKPGGIIVYSTCTLAPEENEQVIDWILEKERGVVEIESVELPLKDLQSGLTRWSEKEFSPLVQATARILPSELREGFFIAKLRKIKSNVK